MEGFPSGQREQTVNLSSMTSVVRIHHLPPKRKDIPKGMSFLLWRKAGGGFERWLLETCRWHVSTTVALPQQSESTTERVGTRVAVRLWDCTSQSRQARALNGASALRNVPVARFNHRGFAAAKRIHHRTGRQVCGSAVRGLHQTLKLDTRPKRSAGSWKRAGGTFQPAWLCRSKANPPPDGQAGV